MIVRVNPITHAIMAKMVAGKPPLEREVQSEVVQFFRGHGCVVRSLSQYRASMVSVGIPDLHISHPKKGYWFWFEVKRPKKHKDFHRFKRETWLAEPLRPAQEAFRLDCLATGQPFYFGGVQEAIGAIATECRRIADQQYDDRCS